MGKSRQRKDAFKAAHPFCIFCGGTTEATTIEHCPPRAMFQNREWPEGFEFPACSGCNHGSADDDLIVAFIARTDPFNDAGNMDGRMPAILGSVHQKFPGLLRKMMPSPIAARRMNRHFGITPPIGGTNQETGAVHVTEEMDRAVEVFSAKLVKAIYYLQTNTPIPPGSRLALCWFTNAELMTNEGRYPIFDLLEQLNGVAPELRRAKSFLNDQFSYKASMSEERELIVVQAKFGQGFGLVVLASTIAEKLDDIFRRAEERTGRVNPFTIL